jgi:hypothetical protein
MAIPRVFISSTCYDLKYIRENLKYFIREIGYEPVLSDEGDVFYNPGVHTHESCICEVGSCNIFVLIIGGRYGGKHIKKEASITNMEYKEAIRLKIPVFTLVDSNVYSNHFVYTENLKKNTSVDAKDIKYPSIDNIKIFEFIDEVRKCQYNNAFFPFRDFADIKSYLLKQWAGMMYSFLTSESEARRVGELFDSLNEATRKIEIYTKEMANNVVDEPTKLTIKLYESLLNSEIVGVFSRWNIKLNPTSILSKENVDEYCNNEIDLKFYDDKEGHVTQGGGPPYRLSKAAYKTLATAYISARQELLNILKEHKISVDQYLNENTED